MYKTTQSLSHLRVAPYSWDCMISTERKKRVETFVRPQNAPNTHLSSNGVLTVKKKKKHRQKPQQKRRPRSEKTT